MGFEFFESYLGTQQQRIHMTINEATVKGKWLEIKGEIQKTWGKLTSDEIEQTKGDFKSISGLILQRYGQESEKFQDRLSSIFSKYSETKDATVEKVKENLKS